MTEVEDCAGPVVSRLETDGPTIATVPNRKPMQERGPESQESVMGDGVRVNGVDDQAARRAHMREQTTARQAAERHLGYPKIRRNQDDYQVEQAVRVAAVRAELERVNAAHQTWLRADSDPA